MAPTSKSVKIPALQGPPAAPPEALPFTRDDLYGTYALNPISTLATWRLGFLTATLVPLKAAACIFCVLCYWLICVIGNAVLQEPHRGRILIFWGKFWTRALLYCIGFWSLKWVYVGPDGSESSKASDRQGSKRFGGYVSNHGSWADIIIYMSKLFPSFVAKKDVSTLPLVGVIAKVMQCLFVDREARLAAAAAAGAPSAADAARGEGGEGMSVLVRERMERKYNDADDPELHMMLFPEGTTTNNKYLLPFKRGAFLAGVPVQPLVIRYHLGSRFWPTWEAMPGHKHILLLMTELSYSATVYVLPVYEPSEEERRDPSLYANNVRDMLLKYSKLTPTESTFADKIKWFKTIEAHMAGPPTGTAGGSAVGGKAAPSAGGGKAVVHAKAA